VNRGWLEKLGWAGRAVIDGLSATPKSAVLAGGIEAIGVFIPDKSTSLPRPTAYSCDKNKAQGALCIGKTGVGRRERAVPQIVIGRGIEARRVGAVPITTNVSYGSKAAVRRSRGHVRCTLDSGH
jgi:hypothetical protein